MLYSGCILRNYDPSWLRISIMSRHTLNDGVTPDIRLEGMFAEHWPQLGPPSTLIGQYLRKEISWYNFDRGYSSYLATQAQAEVDQLMDKIASEDVIVLCIEAEELDVAKLKCHRRLLLEHIRRLTPDLVGPVR